MALAGGVRHSGGANGRACVCVFLCLPARREVEGLADGRFRLDWTEKKKESLPRSPPFSLVALILLDVSWLVRPVSLGCFPDRRLPLPDRRFCLCLRYMYFYRGTLPRAGSGAGHCYPRALRRVSRGRDSPGWAACS